MRDGSSRFGKGPGVTVLRCSFENEATARAVAEALAGPGGPAGIAAVDRDGAVLAIHVDATRTPVALVAAIVDAERRGGDVHGASRPPDDGALTALASRLLSEPDLDTSRLIETYVEPMLGMK